MLKLGLFAAAVALSLPVAAAAQQVDYREKGDVSGAASAYSADKDAGARAAEAYGADTSYAGAEPVDAREHALDLRIRADRRSGALNTDDAERAFGELDRIRQHEADLRDQHDGLTGDDRADLAIRLDALGERISDEAAGG